MGMGIYQWEWEGMGILIVFPHSSNGNREFRAFFAAVTFSLTRDNLHIWVWPILSEYRYVSADQPGHI